MLHALTVGFYKVLIVVFYFSWLSRFNLHSCTAASFNVPAVIVYEEGT